MKIYRQGDVCLVQVKAIPADAVEQPIKGTDLVLAHGEVTGHKHRFEFMDTSHNAKLRITESGARYLDVLADCDLLHEEHSTVRVPKGRYLLPQQVDYTPAELRRVAD
jgi:hypothetical protein